MADTNILPSITMSNAWLLYRKVHKTNDKKTLQKKVLSSADFREEIATVLCKIGIMALATRRSIEPKIKAEKRKSPA